MTNRRGAIDAHLKQQGGDATERPLSESIRYDGPAVTQPGVESGSGLSTFPGMSREEALRIANEALCNPAHRYRHHWISAHYAELRDSVADALQRVAAPKQEEHPDTARLDWLSAQKEIQGWPNRNNRYSFVKEDKPDGLIEADTLREAIDRAREDSK